MFIQVFSAFVATVFFGIMFNIPKKELLYCGFVGAVGWFIYILCLQNGLDTVFASFLSSLVLSIISHILAIYRKNPVTVYQIAGIIPIVPGGLLYTGVFHILQEHGSGMNTSQAFVEALEIAASIALGMLFVQAIMKLVHHILAFSKSTSL